MESSAAGTFETALRVKASRPIRLRNCIGGMDGPVNLLVSVDTRIEGNTTLPLDQYSGTFAWKKTATCKGVERSKKPYEIKLPAEDVVRWAEIRRRAGRRA